MHGVAQTGDAQGVVEVRRTVRITAVPPVLAQALQAGQVRRYSGSLDERPNPVQDGVAGSNPVPEQAHLPPGGVDEAEQHPQRRGLARAVRAEQSHDLARCDPEGHVVHGKDAPPEPFAEPDDVDGRGARRLHSHLLGEPAAAAYRPDDHESRAGRDQHHRHDDQDDRQLGRVGHGLGGQSQRRALHRADEQGGGLPVGEVGHVGRGEHQPQRVAGGEQVRDAGQRDLDDGAGAGRPGQPQGRDLLLREGELSVGGGVVELREQRHRVCGGDDPDRGAGRPHHVEVAAQRSGLERHELAGDVEGEVPDELPDLDEPRDARQRGHARRAPTGRVEHRLRRRGDRLLRSHQLPGAGQRVARGAPRRRVLVGRSHPADIRPGVGEGGWQDDAGVAFQPVVEPRPRHVLLTCLVGVGETGVMAAGQPHHPDGSACGQDAQVAGDRLRHREERVSRTLHEQGRGMNLGDHARGAGPGEQGHRLRIRRAVRPHVLEGLAHRGEQAGAAPTDADGEDPRPLLLVHAGNARRGSVREQRGDEAVPGDGRHDRVHPPVVGGGEQGDPTAVGGSGEPHPRVVRPVKQHPRLAGEPGDELLDVEHLVVGGVEGDLAGGVAEPPG